MQVIPAVDVRAGRAVRLVEGDFARETVYGEDPVATARAHAGAGARRLHVVDLDGASGRGDNRTVITRIVRESGIEVQVAGGVRTVAVAQAWLAAGARAVVVGTMAVRDPELFAELVGALPGQVMAALDVRAGRPAVTGWSATEAVELEQLLVDWEGLELAGIILTAVDRDGTLTGPDLPLLNRVSGATRHPITYSGGIAGMNDLVALAATGIHGAIVGKSIYEGTIDLAAAVASL